MKRSWVMLLALALALWAPRLALAEGKVQAAPKVGPVRKALGNYLVGSSRRSIRAAEKWVERGEKLEASKNGAVKKTGRFIGIFGAVRGLTGVLKGNIADMLLRTPNTHGWQHD